MSDQKTACTLSNEELLLKSTEWVKKLAETGGQAWALRVPVDFNTDPDVLFLELCKRLKAYAQVHRDGVALIALERAEQLTKHGRSVADDVKINDSRQLAVAAVSLIEGDRTAPMDWEGKLWDKMSDKCYKDRLVIAGALIAAEIDRLQNQ